MKSGWNQYVFVRNLPDLGTVEPEIARLFGNDQPAFMLFELLMDKLRAIATDRNSFWHRRDAILHHARNLTVVVDKYNDLVAFYVLVPNARRKASDIAFFQVFDEGKGIARLILQKELAETNLYVSRPLPSSRGFWKKMGIKCGDDN